MIADKASSNPVSWKGIFQTKNKETKEDIEMSTVKKAIMVIENRILIDGKVMSDGHSSHKVAIEVAKKMKGQEEYKEHDILVFPPKKNINYSPKTFRYKNQGVIEKPINLSEKKVKGIRKSSIDKLEAKLEKAKAELAQLNSLLD